ncbi:hypothetical protein RLEG12_00725 (plasmid) [Rhizobium leguminosarum bv. trifolii CB782]|nr:hypothetical protein RLEG12_00725 [Rhizobium leguminosarum bv. trifolii CB782]
MQGSLMIELIDFAAIISTECMPAKTSDELFVAKTPNFLHGILI